jgi:hypothetical protein
VSAFTCPKCARIFCRASATTFAGASSSCFSTDRKQTRESPEEPLFSSSETSPAAATTEVASVTWNENSLAWIMSIRIVRLGCRLPEAAASGLPGWRS